MGGGAAGAITDTDVAPPGFLELERQRKGLARLERLIQIAQPDVPTGGIQAHRRVNGNRHFGEVFHFHRVAAARHRHQVGLLGYRRRRGDEAVRDGRGNRHEHGRVFDAADGVACPRILHLGSDRLAARREGKQHEECQDRPLHDKLSSSLSRACNKIGARPMVFEHRAAPPACRGVALATLVSSRTDW